MVPEQPMRNNFIDKAGSSSSTTIRTLIERPNSVVEANSAKSILATNDEPAMKMQGRAGWQTETISAQVAGPRTSEPGPSLAKCFESPGDSLTVSSSATTANWRPLRSELPPGPTARAVDIHSSVKIPNSSDLCRFVGIGRIKSIRYLEGPHKVLKVPVSTIIWYY